LVAELPESLEPHERPDGLARLLLWPQKMGRLLLAQPDPSELDPNDLVDVFSTEKAGDLAAVQSILKSHGIEHVIADCEEPNVLCHATLEKRVMVRRDELSEARKALSYLLEIAHRDRERAEIELNMKIETIGAIVLLLGLFVVLLVMAALGIRWP
jgi:hypothetical protein